LESSPNREQARIAFSSSCCRRRAVVNFHLTGVRRTAHEAAFIGCHRFDGGERTCMGSIIDGDGDVSLSETQSGWQVKSNRAMLLVDERCLQPNFVGADRIVPVASVAASRDLDASSSTQRAATSIAATNLHQDRPSGICRVVSAAPGVLEALKVVRPETVIRWHRASFRAYWRWKSKPRNGRPKTPLEIRQLIRKMSLANPLWGAPRIHGELLKLGIDVGQTTVAKYIVRGRRPPSQGWKTFLHSHADGIASMDLFVVPTISFRLL
jgi:hypothetical protein